MNKSKVEWKVGLFVLMGLALAAVMVMRFSKGTGFARTYLLHLQARDAGGIIPGSSVLMSGVPIGSIEEIHLAPDGSSVTMEAQIFTDYKISSNAVFSIGTVGFLGDRYIGVSAGKPDFTKKIGYRQPGDYVNVVEAFDFSEVAESASGLMNRLSGTVDQLSNAVVRLDKTVLSDQSLSNVTSALANVRGLSEKAAAAVENVDALVRSNTPAINGSVSNLNVFTAKLNTATDELREVVATNRAGVTASLKNVERATERADKILQQVEQGRGLAGTLLSNEEVARDASRTMSNVAVFTGNLNERGLWGVLKKPKPPKKE